MRSLSDVLEQQRVIRAQRAASLDEALVYVIDAGKQVVALPFVKFTPKFVKFDTCRKAGTRGDAPAWCAYADRKAFEAGKPAEITGGPNGFFWAHCAWRTREAAEQYLADWQRPRPRAHATADEERIIRAAHRAMDLRGRGKSGVHTTTEACRVIRELLDVLAAITGIDSADETLPVQVPSAERSA
jgi:hypothetical protein